MQNTTVIACPYYYYVMAIFFQRRSKGRPNRPKITHSIFSLLNYLTLDDHEFMNLLQVWTLG